MFFKRLFSAAVPPVSLVSATAGTAPVLTHPPAAEAETLATQLAAVTAERDQANAALEQLRAQFRDLTANAADADLQFNARIAGLEAVCDALTAERDQLKADLAADRDALRQQIRAEEVANIAASQGIPLADVPPASSESTDTVESKRAEIMEQMKACGHNPLKRGQLAMQLKALNQSAK